VRSLLNMLRERKTCCASHITRASGLCMGISVSLRATSTNRTSSVSLPRAASSRRTRACRDTRGGLRDTVGDKPL
jgi:hypothetical protein